MTNKAITIADYLPSKSFSDNPNLLLKSVSVCELMMDLFDASIEDAIRELNKEVDISCYCDIDGICDPCHAMNMLRDARATYRTMMKFGEENLR